MTPEQELFQSDGSRKWYDEAWRSRVAYSAVSPPKTYVPMELLEAALQFLRRASHFTPEGEHSLTNEINKFLGTFDPPAENKDTR